MMENPLLRIEALRLAHASGPPVVDGVGLELKAGERLGLVGASGSGKSTLAHAIAGLLPTGARQLSGAISFGTLPPGRRRYGMIFQEPRAALNPTHRCGRQLLEAIGVYFPELSRAERRTLALEWLAKVRLPDRERILRAYPHQLSGGQLQRLLIAMALAGRPALLIADEPTTALDTVTELAILQLLNELTQSEETALLFISHDLAVVRYVSDRMLVLEKGRPVISGPTRTLIEQASNPTVRDMVSHSARLRLDRSGRTLDKPFLRPNTGQKPLLEVRKLSYAYGSKAGWWGSRKTFTALEGIDLSIGTGSFVALVGESGCGKTTLGRCLNGLLPDYTGTVRIHATGLAPVQTVFQDPAASLNPTQTAAAAVGEVLRLHRPGLARPEFQAALSGLFDRVDLPLATYGARYPDELSGGQKQRVAIARALAADPALLICDEAVSGLDAELQTEIVSLLQKRCAADGLSVLFISHDLALVLERADRVLIMDGGRIVLDTEPTELLRRVNQESRLSTPPAAHKLLAAARLG